MYDLEKDTRGADAFTEWKWEAINERPHRRKRWAYLPDCVVRGQHRDEV